MSYIDKNSFKFGTIDMWEKYGIQCTSELEDVFLPALRSRKVMIPQRSGMYDYGAQYYDERVLRLSCTTIKPLSRADIRNISYDLAKKNRIFLWNEPEKYYIGRIYEVVPLDQTKKFVQLFDLSFVCDPFAYGNAIQKSFNNRIEPNYEGTAPTPTRIEIVNTGTVNAVGIRITQIIKKE